MPRFYFDLHNDLDVRDDEGRELPDLAAARAESIREAREMMTESVRNGRVALDHRIVVRDESDATVCVMRFGDAVEIVRA